MGCNCGKNKSSSVSKTKKLQETFLEQSNSNSSPDVNPDSIPQVQTTRHGDKTVIKVKTPSLGTKVKNFAKAVGSRVAKGRASEEIVSLRQLSCHGDNDIPPCPYRGNSAVREGFYFCTACGCGDKPHTWLNNPEDPESYTKLHYPWVSCPVRNPGFGDYKEYELETKEELEAKPEGMSRKKVIETYLKAKGTVIPDHPAPQPKKGE
tara:strand:+ start:1639 stop:2259 length:621 start_codon:yes stop_codon:yes gene_type:complete